MMPSLTRCLALGALVGCALTPRLHAQVVTQASASPPLAPVLPAGLELTIDEPVGWSMNGSITTRDITAAVQSSIRVTGTAKHPLGIGDVQLNKNRASLADMPDGSTLFTGYVKVTEKMTSAEIAIVTKSGLRIPVHVNITPTQPPPPAPTPDSAWKAKTDAVGFHGKRWAVIIGISDYADKDIPALKYAAADAKSMYDFLRSPLAGGDGFQAENIRILLNKEATYTNIRVALFDFLKQAAPEDVVYIYYAGHGAPDPERRENLYLLPYDAKPGQLGGTAFPMEDMNKALRQVAASHKILFTDACHSGGVTVDGTRAGLTDNAINTAFLDRLSSSKGVHASFTASGTNQTSLEGEQWGGGHGVFTYYLLKGLAGEADANADHIVDLDEAMEFTTTNVAAATRRAQVPTIGPTAYDGSFPVGMVIPGQEIQSLSLAEIERTQRINTLRALVLDYQWILPDSFDLVAGEKHLLQIEAQTPKKDIVPPGLVTWISSNKLVATVDSDGVVTPLSKGMIQITAINERENRKVSTLIRVLPTPTDVLFEPKGNTLDLVLTESFKVKSDLLIETNQWFRGRTPQLTLSDTLIVRQQPGLEFVAYREGNATLTAKIAGFTHVWEIRVVPPRVRAKPIPPSMTVGDSVPLGAWRIRPTGAAIGDAPSATWRPLDSTRATVRDGYLIGNRIGPMRAVVSLGEATDTVSTFVLGELVVGIENKAGAGIITVGMSGGPPVALLPAGLAGSQAVVSPKGDQIAYVANKRVHVMNLDGSNSRRVTPDMKGSLGVRISSYEEHSPAWIAEGSRLAFISNAHGNYEVLSIALDGTDPQRLTSTGQQERHVSADASGQMVAFERLLASDDAEVVMALADGSQQKVVPHKVPFGEKKYAMVKPKFAANASLMFYVKRMPGRDGEALQVMDAGTMLPSSPTDLVPPQRDHAILYAPSPDGKFVAYHRLAEWGDKNSSIIVVDRAGSVVKTISLANGTTVRSIAWGVAPATATKGEKK